MPQSHPFIERLMGSVRIKYLDKTLFWNKKDLTAKLEEFCVYFNENRAHSSLGGFSPADVDEKKKGNPAGLANFSWQKYCRGLFELPVSA